MNKAVLYHLSPAMTYYYLLLLLLLIINYHFFVLCLRVVVFLLLATWLLTPHNIKQQLNNYNYNNFYSDNFLYYNRYRSLVPRNITFFTPRVL